MNDPMFVTVETDTLTDVEVGCEVFSKTIMNGNYPAGGVVADCAVNVDGSFEFTVVRWRPGQPYLHVFDGDDIDLPVCRFNGAAAANESARLHSWLGERKNKRLDRDEKATWSRVALRLAEAAMSGLYLPVAEERYRRRRDAQQAAWAAEMATPESHVGLVPKTPDEVEGIRVRLEARIDAARARLNADGCAS